MRNRDLTGNYSVDIWELISRIQYLDKRVRVLERDKERWERKRAFKQYVIVGSNDQCLEVVNNHISLYFEQLIYKVKTLDCMTVYHFKREYLDNAEVVVIGKTDYIDWKKNNKPIEITMDDLDHMLKGGHKW